MEQGGVLGAEGPFRTGSGRCGDGSGRCGDGAGGGSCGFEGSLG